MTFGIVLLLYIAIITWAAGRLVSDLTKTPEPERVVPPELVPEPGFRRRSWLPGLCMAFLLFIGVVALLLPAVTRTNCDTGATLSAKQIQADRERQIMEAMRVASEDETAR